MFYFEEINSGLVCSSPSGLPLVRYDLKDCGGVITFKDILNIFNNNKRNLISELRKININTATMNLPFVYVYERKDMTVVFSGANIYPETIKKVLVINDFCEYFSGKFNLQIKYDKDLNQSLVINIELRKGVDNIGGEIEKKVRNIILERLLIENSEYKVIYQTKGMGKAEPIIKLWVYGHPEFFNGGGKHKWVTK
jgi:phenylacetate-CoA ligase